VTISPAAMRSATEDRALFFARADVDGQETVVALTA
jgi:hypothetical protein